MRTDTLGTPYANLHDLRRGMTVRLDKGFTCHEAGVVDILQDYFGNLCFRCKDGFHALSGQMDETDEDGALIGVYLC